MGVLQDFERRLEGAVEGFFARAFRSGLQPIELAKALQRYAEDTQHVTADGVVVPNVFRYRVNPKDHERLSTLGDQLTRELADVLVRTAEERHWKLRGPVAIRVEQADDVRVGMYELTGRVEAVEQPAPPARPAGKPEDHTATQVAGTSSSSGTRPSASVQVISGGDAGVVGLTGPRVSAGRQPSNDLVLTDSTVSREHAAFVRRGGRWWVLDLGSTNGTRVNGVGAAEHELHDGDRIELGEAVVEFVEH